MVYGMVWYGMWYGAALLIADRFDLIRLSFSSSTTVLLVPFLTVKLIVSVYYCLFTTVIDFCEGMAGCYLSIDIYCIDRIGYEIRCLPSLDTVDVCCLCLLCLCLSLVCFVIRRPINVTTQEDWIKRRTHPLFNRNPKCYFLPPLNESINQTPYNCVLIVSYGSG
jgi:hypothetical protein